MLPSLIRSSARAGTAGKKTSAQPARRPRLVQAATAPTIGGAAILTTARAGNLAASRYCDRLHVGGGHGSSAQRPHVSVLVVAPTVGILGWARANPGRPGRGGRPPSRTPEI
ncbi:hypothetical protein MAHJHV61_43240 [Mycobacterium avium subsp. hominissuis]|nr:hypothetical protein MAH_3244 [Mycobacterium avium subsp. hominissuis TH135]